MKLKTCLNCENGAIKDNQSFCQTEACYSHLTTCIQKKALAAYLKQERIVDECSCSRKAEIHVN